MFCTSHDGNFLYATHARIQRIKWMSPRARCMVYNMGAGSQIDGRHQTYLLFYFLFFFYRYFDEMLHLHQSYIQPAAIKKVITKIQFNSIVHKYQIYIFTLINF